jgi:carboxypeptidase Q
MYENRGRLCGSPQATKAVEWAKSVLLKMSLDTVYTQKVMVHHWERGEKETAGIVSTKFGSKDVNICALGESIGTPENGITSKVIEVKNFDELKKLGKEKVAGKIVFFNRAMDPTDYNTFEAYGGAVDQRGHGAIEAAKYGAIGVIVRSMTLDDNDIPHTGIMRYDTTITKVPAAAINTKDANLLSDWLKQDANLQFHFKMNCKFFPETESCNVIGEIKGSQYPKEIILVGGHIDSWDIAQGAHDDGAGLMHSIETMRLIKALKIVPKHTIRVVLFMDEECAQRGGRKYAVVAKEKSNAGKEKHIAAIESDEGGFTPSGFSIESSSDTLAMISKWKNLFLPYGVYNFQKQQSGVDIYYLKGLGFPRIGLNVDSQLYFDYHHSSADSFDKINNRQMQLGSAAVASLVYLIDKYGIK